MKKLIGSVLILTFILWAAIRIISGIAFDRCCEGYLKRAADANTIELAKKQLKIAVDNIEEKELIKGYTSIIYRTPDEDIGFWHENLKASLDELSAISPDATPLEKSNMLMKLRETLLDEGQSTSVTVPSGISVYPSNTALAIFGVASLILAVFGIVLWNLD